MRPRTLVVDDEKNIRRMLSIILKGADHEVREAGSGEEALSLLADAPADLVLLDVGLPGMDGIETLKRIAAAHPGVAVVMISGQGSIATAVEATRLGAFDFLEKPLSKDRVLIAVRNALQVSSLGEEVSRHQRSEAQRHVMVGESGAIASLKQQIRKVGPTGATVLVSGESGTGKELVARALHDASPRAGRAFVKVNCAAIPEEMIETELFGCVRGAYTGADRSRDGKFLLADGGTLFLDEIGDMSLRVQAKVLRALQEGEIERVGDSRVHAVDVRVIAATNKDLPAEVAAGRFREDLFFRLNVIPLAVPPLRERPEDIPKLANHFLQLYAAENDLPAKELSPGALGLIRELSWRGNVRELRNVIERLAILSDGPVIREDDLRVLAPVSAAALPPGPSAPGPAEEPAREGWPMPSLDEIRAAGGLVHARREFERRCITACLDRTGGNVSQAASWLMIERSNLHKKMQAYGLEARPPRPGSEADSKEES
ncbi:MAG: sigma-54-dependent Fis family transcriptional regulator [Candidatus Eisenbacteria bacterium]|nr:sigma-54-dependent Fis family transcriptional regulator [Candidatus Eisenbacteria bacterium]